MPVEAVLNSVIFVFGLQKHMLAKAAPCRPTISLAEKKIFPVVKDESESARLAGFGISNPSTQQVFLHEDEIEIGEKILEHLF